MFFQRHIQESTFWRSWRPYCPNGLILEPFPLLREYTKRPLEPHFRSNIYFELPGARLETLRGPTCEPKRSRDTNKSQFDGFRSDLQYIGTDIPWNSLHVWRNRYRYSIFCSSILLQLENDHFQIPNPQRQSKTSGSAASAVRPLQYSCLKQSFLILFLRKTDRMHESIPSVAF